MDGNSSGRQIVGWQFFDFYLPGEMPRHEAVQELRQRILTVANDRGDFVGGFRIDRREAYTEGWDRWTAGYLPGPPRIGRFQRHMTEVRASSR